uniref:Uncharacterized protein n=1 Tax=Panagrolaimus davidi TaxID=227884 RepID=A0A914QQ15_9BILA
MALLLLEYVDNFDDNQKADLIAELVRHGGTKLSPTVFHFATMDDIFIAQHAMIKSGNFDHLFFHSRGLGINGERQNPTIRTKMLLSYSETNGKYKLCQEFKFFHA